MARRAAEIGMALALVAVLAGYVQPQSSCTTALLNLAPCLSYIMGNSTVPSTSCCSQLASVVQSQPQCLCLVLSSGASSSLGIPINTTQALALPGACNVKTPPVSQCNATAGGPAASPPDSPKPTPASPSTPDAPSTPNSPSGTPSTPSVPDTPSDGSKTTPSTDGQSSDGNSGKTTRSLMASLLFVAACFSAITSF